MKRRLRCTALGMTVACLGMFGGEALAATPTPAGGVTRVWVNFNVASPNTQKILFTGAIGDYGTTTSEDKNGKTDPNGDYVKVALRQGGFVIDSTTLDKKSNAAPGTSNLSTCSFWAVVTAPVTLSGGTGLYAGISGTLTATESFAGVGARFTSGAKKGQCNQNGQPLSLYGSITAVGKVSFA